MSTSVRELTPIQTVFLRPTFFISFMIAVIAIYSNPSYNVMIFGGGFLLYVVMHQLRGYIYRLGLSRFYLLIGLFYLPLLLSLFINIDFSVDGFSKYLGSTSAGGIWYFVSDEGYRGRVLDYLAVNADSLIHWKMLIFAPLSAVLFYVLNVELDRKKVKQADIEYLHITKEELFSSNDYIEGIGLGALLLCCLLYGVPSFLLGIIFIAMFAWLRLEYSAVIAGMVFIGLLLLNLFSFNWEIFLKMGNLFSSHEAQHGLWMTIKDLNSYAISHKISQAVILLPYLGVMLMVSLTLLRNRNVYSQISEERSKQTSIDSDVDSLVFASNLTTGKDEMLTHKELNLHVFINGTTGSGKTVAFMNFVVDSCEKNLPLVYVDGKGSRDLEDIMGRIAAYYGRTFRVFSLSPNTVSNPMGYDFLGSGNFTERKNRIMNLFITAQEAGTSYYQDRVERLVNGVFRVIDHHNLNVDLFRFLKLVNNINDLIEMSSVMDDDLREYFLWIRDEKRDNPRQSLLNKLDVFINSVYGRLFDVMGKDNVINLRRSIENNEIVLFLFDASSYSLDTQKVAKMVISDLNSSFSEFGSMKKFVKTYCCFDEFKSYETEAIASTIALHRSNGMHAIIGTQSIGLINRDISRAILANCNTYLSLSCASDEDSRIFADTFGTYKRYETATHIKTDVQEVTGITSKQVEDYIVSPQDIKNIIPGSGMGYLYRKAAGRKPVKVKVYKKF